VVFSGGTAGRKIALIDCHDMNLLALLSSETHFCALARCRALLLDWL